MEVRIQAMTLAIFTPFRDQCLLHYLSAIALLLMSKGHVCEHWSGCQSRCITKLDYLFAAVSLYAMQALVHCMPGHNRKSGSAEHCGKAAATALIPQCCLQAALCSRWAL